MEKQANKLRKEQTEKWKSIKNLKKSEKQTNKLNLISDQKSLAYYKALLTKIEINMTVTLRIYKLLAYNQTFNVNNDKMEF